jgi:acyl carrier protein
VNPIVELLQGIRPEFDFASSSDFIKDGMLDSFDVVTLVSELDKKYKISIAGIDIVPEHFRDVASIENLVRKYTAQI